ncbi:MAG: glycosyltransferase family 25 protein [Notoacmeibacter sp.]|nr:glycosyltransferase family 25 protein [Notoacmeibacter sp.]
MIEIFYINLDESLDRREWFEAQAGRLGLKINRIAAVSGTRLAPAEVQRLQETVSSGITLGPREIGCFLSHRKAWEAFLQTGEPWGFIAEDDLHLSGDVAPFFRSAKWIPADADVVKPETTFRMAHMGRDSLPVPGGRVLRRLLSLHGGAGGYFVSRSSAEALLELTGRRCEPADHVVFNPDFGFFSGKTVYQIDPAFAVQDLLIKGPKAAFEQSGLAPERRMTKTKSIPAKIRREIIRPFRRATQRVADTWRMLTERTVFRAVQYKNDRTGKD